jgi:hypothetical protein
MLWSVDPATQEDVVANPLAEQYGEALLEKISRDMYPSATQMDMLEAIATPRLRVQFIFLLMERLEEDEFPSIPLMQRAQRLIMSFGA